MKRPLFITTAELFFIDLQGVEDKVFLLPDALS